MCRGFHRSIQAVKPGQSLAGTDGAECSMQEETRQAGRARALWELEGYVLHSKLVSQN